MDSPESLAVLYFHYGGEYGKQVQQPVQDTFIHYDRRINGFIVMQK
jgi:hypothetical protein